VLLKFYPFVSLLIHKNMTLSCEIKDTDYLLLVAVTPANPAGSTRCRGKNHSSLEGLQDRGQAGGQEEWT